MGLSKYMAAICAGLVAVQMAAAHNWIESVSRSTGASTIRPCRAPVSINPHVQVGAKQEFEVEWTVFHSGTPYFIVLHADDYDKLAGLDTKILNAYLDEAPASAIFGGDNDPRYQKYHRNFDTRNVNNGVNNFFDQRIDAGAFHFPRPAEFGNGRPMIQWSYKKEERAGDKRACYTNDKWPWIECVSKFTMPAQQPNLYDFAKFWVPGKKGPGRYIVHYRWNGYYDCVDVNYFGNTRQVDNSLIYGEPSEDSSFLRVDHCYFTNPDDPNNRTIKASLAVPCREIVTSTAECQQLCSNSGRCRAAVVSPITLPDTVYSGFKNIQTIPWGDKGCANNTADYRKLTQNFKDAYICYGVEQDRFKDNAIVTSDPEHPGFYSTCLIKSDGKKFIGQTAAPPRKIDWRFGQKCLGCDAKNTFQKEEVIPKWKLNSQRCINCDLTPTTATADLAVATFKTDFLTPDESKKATRVATKATCDGAFMDSTTLEYRFRQPSHHDCPENPPVCVKDLVPLLLPLTQNRRNVDFDECLALIKRDPECSNTFMFRSFRNPGPQVCKCYLKKACCKTCSSADEDTYEIFELTPTPADPTCAKGKLSADGKSCCSSTCAQCTNKNSQSVGFCDTAVFDLTRSCKQFGAPCVM